MVRKYCFEIYHAHRLKDEVGWKKTDKTSEKTIERKRPLTQSISHSDQFKNFSICQSHVFNSEPMTCNVLPYAMHILVDLDSSGRTTNYA